MWHLKRPRPVLAVIAAAFASTLPWLAVAAIDLRLAALEPPCNEDCVSTHFGGFLVLATPFVFLAALVFSSVIGNVLVDLGRRKLTTFLLAALVAALLFALLPTVWLSQPARFGLRDVVPWFLAWSALIGSGALLSALSWWWLTVAPNPSFKRTRLRRSA